MFCRQCDKAIPEWRFEFFGPHVVNCSTECGKLYRLKNSRLRARAQRDKARFDRNRRALECSHCEMTDAKTEEAHRARRAA